MLVTSWLQKTDFAPKDAIEKRNLSRMGRGWEPEMLENSSKSLHLFVHQKKEWDQVACNGFFHSANFIM